MDALFDMPQADASEQAVTARFRLGGEKFGEPDERAGIYDAKRAMTDAVETTGVGEVDGNEFGGGEAVVYAYGPNADALFKVMEPMLRELPFDLRTSFFVVAMPRPTRLGWIYDCPRREDVPDPCQVVRGTAGNTREPAKG
ncbi:hypothetical protein [Streptomyces rhizosphaerihabitans]|uniref:hypothetical protein n=1 Tax=Streptomyces rhizosphaerihabitans TaxID=1266770 RepID=UPI0021C16E6A|nr:hypothetical protein [Streptomyces rhizosphaerihabitans]MCT9008227.1 hypothetical protein [Streptomyces rhizosphaerihabitans]